MEHIVQFAIGIDDKAIQNRIEEYAYRDVLDKLAKNAMDSVFAHTNAYSRDIMWKALMEDALQSFLEERKDEIIDWVKSRCHEAGLSRFDVRRKSDRDFYDGQVNAFHEMLELCRSMLGYSGSMPSEVPNQSEDAKK